MTSGKLRMRGAGGLLLALALLTATASCQKKMPGPDEYLAKKGAFEVTAQLVEIRGEFVNRADYDYAFVMKYKVVQVHRGTIEGDTIYVAHYNPHKPRRSAADARVTVNGGNLVRFTAGDMHRMALEVPIDDYYMGGIINRYFEEYKGPVYWAVWTNGQ